MRINSGSEPILFPDDTNGLIPSRKFEDYFSESTLVLSHMTKLFAAVKLVLNLDKTNIMN
jgi:hypothetical protein